MEQLRSRSWAQEGLKSETKNKKESTIIQEELMKLSSLSDEGAATIALLSKHVY